MKKQKLDLEKNLTEKSIQLDKIKQKMDKHQSEYNDYTQNFSKMEIQVQIKSNDLLKNLNEIFLLFSQIKK